MALSTVGTGQINTNTNTLTQYLVHPHAGTWTWSTTTREPATSPPAPITTLIPSTGPSTAPPAVSEPTGGPEPVGGGADGGSGGFDPSGYPVMHYMPENPSLPGVFNSLFDQAPPSALRPGLAPQAQSWSVFIMGAAGSNLAGTAQLGLTRTLFPDTQIGASLSGTTSTVATAYAGNTLSDSASLAIFLSHTPQTGLQWLFTGSGAYSALSITRGYATGVAALTSSSGGKTASNGYGYSSRLGWSFAVMPQVTTVSYVSFTQAGVNTHAYNEFGGTLPTAFAAVDQTTHTLRLGDDLNYTFNAATTFFAGADWAHQFEPTSSNTFGTILGLFPQFTPGSPVDQDWLEVNAGFNFQISAATSLSFTGSVAAYPHAQNNYQASLNLTRTF